MPDENNPNSASAQPTFVIQMPQSIPTSYVNGWTTRMGQSDFTIQFGLNPVDDPNADIEPVATIVLTHSNLMKLALNLGFASAVVGKLYNGPIPALTDLSRETLEATMENVRNEAEAYRTANSPNKV